MGRAKRPIGSRVLTGSSWQDAAPNAHPYMNAAQPRALCHCELDCVCMPLCHHHHVPPPCRRPRPAFLEAIR